jgi:hypothetical protein
MPFFNDSTDDPLAQDVVQSFVNGQNSFVRASLLQEGQAALLRNVIPKINGELRKWVGTEAWGARYVSGQDNKVQAMLYYDTPSPPPSLLSPQEGLLLRRGELAVVFRRRSRGPERSDRCRSIDGHGLLHRQHQAAYPTLRWIDGD